VDHYYYLSKYDLLNTRFNEKEINKLVKYKNYKIKTIKARAGSVILFDGSNLYRVAPIKTKKKIRLNKLLFS
jgi:predicted 2-oxoglutarate/Fe(II)-dependent dioxygenase YbiX